MLVVGSWSRRDHRLNGLGRLQDILPGPSSASELLLVLTVM